jgi:hypothetical protein
MTVLIRCSPKKNGIRRSVNNTCNKNCIYWKKCIRELKKDIIITSEGINELKKTIYEFEKSRKH